MLERGLLLLTSFILVALVGWVYQLLASHRLRKHFPPPGKLIYLPDHKLKLHLYLSGGGNGKEGNPTIVFESGLGSGCLDWHLLQTNLGQTNRVVSFDRPGYGWSAPRKGGCSPRQLAEELHALLQQAGITPPYVLVGHSLGGLIVQYFTHLYPQEVAGLVLVEAVHPHQFSRLPAKIRRSHKLAVWGWALIHSLSYVGVMRLLLAPLKLTQYPSALRPAVKWTLTLPKTYRAIRTELKGLLAPHAQNQSQNEEYSPLPLLFDHLPLVVLTASRRHLKQKVDPAFEKNWQQLQTELARLSASSTHRVVADSGHYLHLDQPQVVLEAVRAVVEATNHKLT
jgi:pimeloyl-ACP methyl ester carboxylesterase